MPNDARDKQIALALASTISGLAEPGPDYFLTNEEFRFAAVPSLHASTVHPMK